MNKADLKNRPLVIFGPCTMESLEQMKPVVELADKFNLLYVRTPLFKPRTHPGSFQGLGPDGLGILKELKKLNPNVRFVSEVCSLEHIKIAQGHIQMFQIGARNMQNYELLKDIGRNHNGEWVMLKRGFASTLREWLSSAEYLTQHGVDKNKIILCERGTRNACAPSEVTLDFALALKAKRLSGFKVIIDPSHGTRESSLVLPMATASLALDFDGLMIECHPRPKESVSDAHQAISMEDMQIFLEKNYQWEIIPPRTVSPTFSDLLI